MFRVFQTMQYFYKSSDRVNILRNGSQGKMVSWWKKAYLQRLVRSALLTTKVFVLFCVFSFFFFSPFDPWIFFLSWAVLTRFNCVNCGANYVLLCPFARLFAPFLGRVSLFWKSSLPENLRTVQNEELNVHTRLVSDAIILILSWQL